MFLTLIFVFGLGSDERLIVTLDTLVLSRFVYYLGVPLLIGLYFDIQQFRIHNEANQRAGGKSITILSWEQAASRYMPHW